MIIAFTGQPGAGKTTAAQIIQAELKKRAVIISFADPVYQILQTIYTGYEVHFELVKIDKMELKSALPDKYGNTPRDLLRLIGDFGRSKIHADIWVDIAMKEIDKYRDRAVVVIDDLRFPNVLYALMDRGAKIREIVRPGLGTSDHFSDNALSGHQHQQILNTNFAELQKQVLDIIYE